MSTLKALQEEYLAKCYAKAPPSQRAELARAFNAGVLSALTTISKICASPDKHAEEQLEALMNEAAGLVLAGLKDLAKEIQAHPHP